MHNLGPGLGLRQGRFVPEDGLRNPAEESEGADTTVEEWGPRASHYAPYERPLPALHAGHPIPKVRRWARTIYREVSAVANVARSGTVLGVLAENFHARDVPSRLAVSGP